MKRRPRSVDDPLLRECSACGAVEGKPCTTVLNLPLVSRASRLVHADRLKEPAHA